MSDRVTILIAHCNYQDYLADAIRSAKNQTHENIHICIIDDASDNQDSVLDIIEQELGDFEFSELNDQYDVYSGNRYTLIQKFNRTGPSDTRNIGINYHIEDTNYFLILDADDEVYPTKVEVLLNRMNNIPTIGVTYADYHILNTITGIKREEYKHPFSLERLYQECIVHSGAMISTRAIKYLLNKDGYCYDPVMRVAEDYDLWIRIARDFMIVHVAEFLSLVRVQPKNSTDTVHQQIWKDCLQRISNKINAQH